MTRDGAMRGTLWATTAFNFGIAALFCFPDSRLAQIAGFPSHAPRVCTLLLALFIGLFGGAYAWLARQPFIDRPLITVAAIGKTGVFFIVLACALNGEVPLRGAFIATPDLIFAMIFGWWLCRSQNTRRSL